MSKGSTPIKVLRTALKRVDKGWAQSAWVAKNDDGNFSVCLEGALFGYCDANTHGLTDAQKKARDLVLTVIQERYKDRRGRPFESIPAFNDASERTKQEIQEVIKLAIIRLETGGDEEIDEEDFEDLLEFMDQHK